MMRKMMRRLKKWTKKNAKIIAAVAGGIRWIITILLVVLRAFHSDH